MSQYTDFGKYSHGDMRSMVESLDSGAVMAAADPWRRATETLKQIRTALNTAAADTSDAWQGSTSDAFYSHMTQLANSVNNLAAYSNDAAGALQMMSEAIDKAKRDMPEEPGFWDKAGDTVGDFAQESVGISNEDTRTSITDTRKKEAVAVMQTLAATYRVTTQYLKPPLGRIEDTRQLTPPDNGGTAALGALIAGIGSGLVQGSVAVGTAGTVTPRQRSVSSSTPKAPKPQQAVIRPTDAGISGGTANALPQPKSPGTGIDGVQGGTLVRGGGGTIGGTGGAGGVHGPTGTGGLGTVGGVGAGSIGHGGTGMAGGTGIGGSRAGFSGNSVSKAGTFGSGGMGGANDGLGRGSGAGGAGGAGATGGAGGAGGRAGRGLTGKTGGVIGESTQSAGGGRAFSEGGSGIGRSRAGQAAGAGQAGGSGQAGGAQGGGMGGHGQAGKKNKKQGKDRPDYLVEDEETWASGNHVNPNVVE
ncbi:WXG100 family type VII secretion target [Kitasatospora sp. NPDC088391]|uniref:WXG100 family type VII secretion target n=1 Tax=Kitasatospora sp. NPDC088391 TaxID=3364074 RepID=UPI00382015C8